MTRRTIDWVALLSLAALACGSSDQSLCGEPYDDTGTACESESGRIDLQSAEAMARAEVGDEAVLVSIGSDTDRPVGPDGLAESWSFGYRRPSNQDPDAWQGVTVTANEVTSTTGSFPFSSGCTLEESLVPLDSTVVVPDAVRRLEQTNNPVRLGEGSALRVYQLHDCWYVSVPISFDYTLENAVEYSGTSTWSLLEYDRDSSFVALFEE